MPRSWTAIGPMFLLSIVAIDMLLVSVENCHLAIITLNSYIANDEIANSHKWKRRPGERTGDITAPTKMELYPAPASGAYRLCMMSLEDAITLRM